MVRIPMLRRPSSVHRRPQCSIIFSSENAWPMKAKLHMEPPREGGTKIYINVQGHMTKMAATLSYMAWFQQCNIVTIFSICFLPCEKTSTIIVKVHIVSV